MSDIPSQTHEEPTWLDEAYVKKILQKYTDSQLDSVKSFDIVPATKKGENYASLMHLLTVEYTTHSTPDVNQTVSFIVKSRLEGELMSQIEEDLNVFHREAQMYTVIMREAEQLLQSIDDDTVFGPKAVYVDERVIVQENLREKGYAIEDVKRGLDFDECRMILEKLAKFHAVTMVLYKKNPDMFRHHLPGNISENATPLHELYKNAINTTIEYCRGEKLLKQYVPKLEDFGQKIIPKMINVFSRNQADRFHVLNHGDVWVNNLMFRKSEGGQLEDVLFVDYQEGFYGSPGIDWNYFMFSSWQTEVFKKRRPELLEIYHNTLSNTLHSLNYTQRIPTKDDVSREIINKGFHGLTTATCLLPILINEHNDLTDPLIYLLDNEEAKENRRKVFHNPKFGDKLQLFLAFFVEHGVL